MASTAQVIALPQQDAAPIWDALFSEFVRRLKYEERSANTIRNYVESCGFFRRWLIETGRPTDPTLIRKRDIEDWLMHLRESGNSGRGNKPLTVRNRWSGVAAFYSWLLEEKEIEESPVPSRPYASEDEDRPVLTDDEVKAILAACRKDPNTFEARRDEAIVRLLVDSRLRRNEVARLELAKLDRDGKGVVVTVKGGREREAWWEAATAVALDRYIRVRSRHPAAGLPELWLTANGRGAMSGSAIHQMIKRRIKQAGITRELGPIGPHLFCHYAAHCMKASGASDEEVMAWGGWRSARVMRRYARSTKLERAEARFREIAPGNRL